MKTYLFPPKIRWFKQLGPKSKKRTGPPKKRDQRRFVLFAALPSLPSTPRSPRNLGKGRARTVWGPSSAGAVQRPQRAQRLAIAEGRVPDKTNLRSFVGFSRGAFPVAGFHLLDLNLEGLSFWGMNHFWVQVVPCISRATCPIHPGIRIFSGNHPKNQGKQRSVFEKRTMVEKNGWNQPLEFWRFVANFPGPNIGDLLENIAGVRW